MVSCPAHDDRDPSLHLSDGEGGRLLVYCHAGCDQRAVIAALRARGLWPADPGARIQAAPPRRLDPPRKSNPGTSDYIRQIWRAARPAAGTIVETYLCSRHLNGPIPPTLRYYPRLPHRPSGRSWPAMVGAVQGLDGRLVGVHRTWLHPDGGGKAKVEWPRMMLGPCAGGAIRLTPVGESLLVGEGIETCLAAMLATGQPTWAGGSTSGLGALVLPPSVRSVVILADGDAPGEAAAIAAARRWTGKGREVRIARPPRGYDCADLLAGAAASARAVA